MIELFKDIRVDWLGKRKLFLAISGSVMLLGLVSLLAKHPRGFQYGVDFKGGTIVQVRFNKEKPPVDQIRTVLRENGADSQIQELRGATTSQDVLIELEGATEQ